MILFFQKNKLKFIFFELIKKWKEFKFKRSESYSNFSIIFFEVKLLSFWGDYTWSFSVDIVDVIFESSLSFSWSKVPWEFLSVLDFLDFFFVEHHGVSFVHEISAVSFWSGNTIVHQQFQSSPLRSSSSSGSWGNITVEVVMSESPPLSLELFGINQSLWGSFTSDVFWNKESSDSSVDFVISFSSSHFQNPVIWVKSLSGHIFEHNISS